MIPNKAADMDDEILAKFMKVIAPVTRTIKVSNVDCVFTILLSIYITIHL